MNYQDLIHAVNEATKMEAGKEYNLGKLILDLEKQDGNLKIVIDTNGIPISFSSYRGYYNRLAIEYENTGSMTVKEFLKRAKNIVGRTFEGYKGGNYLMDEETPIYVSNYGEAEGLKVIDIKKKKNNVTIVTRREK